MRKIALPTIAILMMLSFRQHAYAQNIQLRTISDDLEIALITGLPNCEGYDGKEDYFERCTGSLVSTTTVSGKTAQDKKKIEDFLNYYRALGELSKKRFAEAIYKKVKKHQARAGGYEFNLADVNEVRKRFIPSTPAEEAAEAKEAARLQKASDDLMRTIE